MLRPTALRAARSVTRLQQRNISFTVSRMAAGDTGGTRSGGSAAGDAFTKREQAEEAMYIRQQEKEKLMELRKKLQEQKKHLKDLEDHIDSIAKESGGEHH